MKNKKINIVCIFSEVDPFSKAGGLGDVGRSLPKAFKELGHNVKVITPLYGVVSPLIHHLKKIVARHKIKIDETRTVFVDYYQGDLGGVPVYFVANHSFFGKYKTIYGASRENARFLLFNLAALKLLKLLKEPVDILHCNDWQTGLIPYFCKTRFKKDPDISKIATVFTIHNLVYQFGKNWWEVQNGDRDDGRGKLPFFAKKQAIEHINFAKRAIIFSDVLNTVSETYAKEILTKDFGEDLHILLRNRKDRLVGILNGIDYHDFNPATDPGIAVHYDTESVEKKRENKLALQKFFSLPQNPHIPLIGMVSRVTEQKGFDLIFEIAEVLMRQDLQLVIFGGGEKNYEKKLARWMRKHPKKFAANLDFDSKKVTQVYAGSDIFLMPSRFEPCGLGQLISLRYGSIPVARATGGIMDTITHYKYGSQKGNGFVFKKYHHLDLLMALSRALGLFENQAAWKQLVRRAMNQTFSWEIPAKKYITLFGRAIKIHKSL